MSGSPVPPFPSPITSGMDWAKKPFGQCKMIYTDTQNLDSTVAEVPNQNLKSLVSIIMSVHKNAYFMTAQNTDLLC